MTMFTRTDKPADNTASPTSAPAPTPTQRVEVKVTPPSETPVARPQAAPVTASATPSQQGQAVSIISKALKITGQLESTEDIQIEGEIDGDVRGVLVRVGSNAKVKGAVYGNEVQLSGTVDGKIEAKKVVLTSTARMSGDVIHQDITIQSGAYISGHCRPEYGKTEQTRTVIPVQAGGGLRSKEAAE